jgi:hypothetical protein
VRGGDPGEQVGLAGQERGPLGRPVAGRVGGARPGQGAQLLQELGDLGDRDR